MEFFMSKNKYFIILALLFAVTAVNAATVSFRSGTLLSAELSARRPNVKTWNEAQANPVYARLVFTLAPERKISIHDYEIVIYGRSFKAIALSINGNKWSADGNTVETHNAEDKIALLFELDGTVIGKQGVISLDLVAAPDRDFPAQTVKFCNLNNQGFSPVNKIPLSGSMVK